MLKLKVLGLFGALLFAAPIAAVAAPAGGMIAHSYADLATAPQAASTAAVVSGDPVAKIENVWWRRGYGWRGYGFRGYGWRGYGYAWRRPYWRRRFFVY